MDLDYDNESYSSAIFVLFASAALLYIILKTERDEPDLKHIPAAGRQTYLLSFLDACRFGLSGTLELKSGLRKYRGKMFKISLLKHWLVILVSKTSIEDLRRAAELEVAFVSVADELDPALDRVGHFQAVIHHDVNGFVQNISRNIAFLIPGMKEEIRLAFENEMQLGEGLTDSSWQEVDGFGLAVQLSARAINRAFFGLPFARHEDLNPLMAAFTRDVYRSKLPFVQGFSSITSLFEIFSSSGRHRRHMRSLLTSFIRRQKDILSGAQLKDEYKNRDMLSWLAQHGHLGELPEEVISNLVNLSVTAHRMISLTFTHVLYHLATNPEYCSPMREEIENLVRRDGWSNNSLERMHKVDSFIKESMRMKCVYHVTMIRKYLKPFTFSEGSYLPAGTLSAVPVEHRHLDSDCYLAANVFDGFRFSRLYERHHADDAAIDDHMNSQFQLVTTTPDFLAWGYGRHACPGRFFSAMAMKIMLAQVLMHYDLKIDNGVKPKDVFFGMARLPDPTVKVQVRKRKKKGLPTMPS